MQLLMQKSRVSSKAARVSALIHKLGGMILKGCFEKAFWNSAAFLMSRQPEWTGCSESKENKEIWKMD